MDNRLNESSDTRKWPEIQVKSLGLTHDPTMEVHKCPVCEEVATKHCGRCNEVYYCTKEHQKQHWRQHKTECKPIKKMEVHRCPVCKEVATKHCGGCNEVYYCTKEHQKKHWRQHKTDCKPYKVSKDSAVGRHLVATRDIKAGEVVMRESPLMRGPSADSPAVCLSCLKRITPATSSPCHKCGWPLCHDAACRQSREHIPECEWTRSRKRASVGPGDFSTVNSEYRLIAPLRLCYARRHQPDLWARLSKLETLVAERRHSARYNMCDKFIARSLRTAYGLQKEFTEEEISDMLGIIEVNAHEVVGPEEDYVALYEMGSLIEHSCVPNCNKSISFEGEMIIRAGQPILKGQHLSICYTDGFLGTTSRFKHLLTTKYFRCRCVRCTDNTEMGTYYSAIFCQNSWCGGVMLPDNLCELTPDSLWDCNRCHLSIRNEKVEGILSLIKDELNMLDLQNSYGIVNFVLNWKSTLPSSHYYMAAAKVYWIERINKEYPEGESDLSLSNLLLKIEWCRRLSALLAKIAPAELRARGIYKGTLCMCLVEKANRLYMVGRSMEGDRAMMESMIQNEEARWLLKNQPEVKIRGKQDIFRRYLNLNSNGSNAVMDLFMMFKFLSLFN